jgi:RimK family alpha-L-glutamate ligase
MSLRSTAAPGCGCVSAAPDTLRLVARVAILGRPTATNGRLLASWRELGIDVSLVDPLRALDLLGAGDVAVARIDVRATLDGVEPGLELLPELMWRGVHVFNTQAALLAAHDKLVTAGALWEAGIPHPRTAQLEPGAPAPLEPPLVVKPRFGSWGRDVFRCEDDDSFRACLAEIADRPWFRRHGALLQELLPTSGRDLRVLVAHGAAVGVATRIAAPGEWRTNVSLGGRLEPATADPATLALALAAARAIGADLVTADLLPLPSGGYIVLELNGAGEFDPGYGLGGRDVDADLACALGLLRSETIRPWPAASALRER